MNRQAHRLATNPLDVIGTLTARQWAMARCLLEGHSGAQIARSLGISVGTVRHDLSRLYSKAGVRNRIELATLLLGVTAAD